MIKDNLKYFFLAFSIVFSVSFFFGSYYTCLASQSLEQAWTTEQGSIQMNWYGENPTVYQPFYNPITNWTNINQISIYACADGDFYNSEDPKLNTMIFSADTVNDCLDPLYNKYVTYWSTEHTLPPQGSEQCWIDITKTGGGVLNKTDLPDYPILCGLYFYAWGNYNSSTSTNIYLRSNANPIYDYPQSVNFSNDGQLDYSVTFNLYGEPGSATTTPPVLDVCDCSFTSTSTNIFDVMGNAISCALKSTACWAFYPDKGTISNFATSTYVLTGKFPLNTYFGLTNAVSSALDTNDTMGGNLGVPMARTVNGHEQTYILSVISSSTMTRAIGSSNNTLFRNGLIWLGWLVVAGIIFIIILSL